MGHRSWAASPASGPHLLALGFGGAQRLNYILRPRGLSPGPEAGAAGGGCSVDVQRVVILEEAGVGAAESLGAGELDGDRLADERGQRVRVLHVPGALVLVGA